MKTVKITTESGGIIILKECSPFGWNSLIHKKNGELFVYNMQDGDYIEEVKNEGQPNHWVCEDCSRLFFDAMEYKIHFDGKHRI